jgi:hypothetical protein
MTTKMTKAPPTAAELRARFNYDPISGELTYKISPARCIKVGQKAGSLGKDGYRRVKIDGAHYAVHRVIWCLVTGRWPQEEIDHRNTRKSDNRWRNLRPATRKENMHNMRGRSPWGKGVSPDRDRFKAQIRINGTLLYLGSFKTRALAAEAYASAARRHHGAYARVA